MSALSPKYMQGALKRLGFEAHITPDMTTAITYIRSGAAVDLVVSDVMMLGGTGVELLDAVRSAGFTTPFLLVSGYAVDNPEALLADDARLTLVSKPWTSEALGGRFRGCFHVQLAQADRPPETARQRTSGVRRALRPLSAAGRVSLAHAYRRPGRDGGRARWLS